MSKRTVKPTSIYCRCGWARVVLDWETEEEARQKHERTDIHRLAMKEKGNA